MLQGLIDDDETIVSFFLPRNAGNKWSATSNLKHFSDPEIPKGAPMYEVSTEANIDIVQPEGCWSSSGMHAEGFRRLISRNFTAF
jgi:hypothetical protein